MSDKKKKLVFTEEEFNTWSEGFKAEIIEETIAEYGHREHKLIESAEKVLKSAHLKMSDIQRGQGGEINDRTVMMRVGDVKTLTMLARRYIDAVKMFKMPYC